MTLASLLLFAAALFVAAGTPGPSIAALVSRVLSRGLGDVLPFLAAMWVGEAIWLSLAIWGLAQVAESFHWLFLLIKWAGVGYLAYLAWKMWHAPLAADAAGPVPERTAPWRMFLAGLSVTLGNPKIMMFYLALLPTLLDLTRVSLFGWAELVVTMVLVLVVIDLGWAVAAQGARRLLRSPRAMRAVNRLSATTMAGAAVAIASR
ncbi:MAG: LysE family translocator [Methylobacterium mesophilicum]|nr:LysE family translocator [Methylobacterium mesophilicum]